jgi:hypothetical protein
MAASPEEIQRRVQEDIVRRRVEQDVQFRRTQAQPQVQQPGKPPPVDPSLLGQQQTDPGFVGPLAPTPTRPSRMLNENYGKGVAAELALQGLTGTLGTLVAGVITAPLGIASKRPIEDQVNAINLTQEALTYSPRLPETQAINESIAQYANEWSLKAQDLIFSVAGESPALATAIHSVPQAILTALGVNRNRLTRKQIKADMADLEQKAKDLGIDIESKDMQGELTSAADRLSGNYRGESLETLQANLKKERDIVLRERKGLYKAAESYDAHLYGKTLDTLIDPLERKINARAFPEGIESPGVKRRMALLRDLYDRANIQNSSRLRNDPNSGRLIVPGPAPITFQLNALDALKKGIPTKGPEADRNWTPAQREEQAIYNIMRRDIEEYVEAQFDTGMFSGDPRAIKAFQNADKFHAMYRKNFRENRFIRKLVDAEATPEMLRNWIKGQAKSGVKVEAGLIVGKLKAILGEDSPQFAAIRKDMLFDILRPLTEKTPNFAEFIKRYDELQVNSPGFVKALDPYADPNMQSLRKFAEAAVDTGGILSESIPELDKLISRSLFGHQIAKAQVKVQLGTSLINMLRNAGKGSQWDQMVKNIVGDTKVPIIPRGSVGHQAFLAYVLNESTGAGEQEDAEE